MDAKKGFSDLSKLTQEDIIKIIEFYKAKPELVHGGSVISYVSKYLLSPKLDGYTKSTTNMIKKYGDVPIIKMEIYRTPLHNMMIKAIDFISLGKFSEMQKKLGYDKFFHLALVLTLKNNKKIIVQKLDVIEVSDSYQTKSNTEVDYVDQYDYRGDEDEDNLTLNELFANARAKVPDNLWFGYDGLRNNCQWFIKYILENSDLYGPTEEKFIFQNIEELVKEMPEYVGDTMNAVTDLAATITKLRGKGKKPLVKGGNIYIVKDLVD